MGYHYVWIATTNCSIYQGFTSQAVVILIYLFYHISLAGNLVDEAVTQHCLNVLTRILTDFSK